MIIDETYNLLINKHSDIINNLVISDVRIGVFLTAVLLSDGSCGAASTNVDSHSHCYKKNRDFGSFSPAKIKGQTVVDLFESGNNILVTDTLKVAVLNAISSRIIPKSGYKILNNVDPIELVDLSPTKTITIVGAFQSYIKKIAATQNKLYVLELDENALNEDQKQFYVPADEYTKVIPISDIVVITGLTLVNNTLDTLLRHVPPEAKVILTGPSSSLIPDVLFSKGVDIMGATKITDQEMLFSVAAEAGTGFHLFKYCAEKFCIVNTLQK